MKPRDARRERSKSSIWGEGKRAFGLVLAAACLFSPAAAQDFPALTGRVVDDANILSPDTEAAIGLRFADWEAESSDQLVLVTIADLQGYEIEDYGYRLGRAWGIGQDEGTDGLGLDNGALLIIAPNERALRVEVGYGLEGTLTDARSAQIVQAMIPALREGDYDAAAMTGATAMTAVLSGAMTEAQDRKRRAPDRPMATGAGEGGFPWPLLLFGAFFLWSFWPRKRRGRVLFDSDRRGGNRGSDVASAIILGQMMQGARRGGGFSSGGFSSGGFGGGFSGGGGSFGGGGASGSW